MVKCSVQIKTFFKNQIYVKLQVLTPERLDHDDVHPYVHEKKIKLKMN
jgi:hypothetical protein